MQVNRDLSCPVSLGPFELTGLEVPSFYDRAGNVQAVVHRLIGGGRMVQLMGPDRARRRLQGYFTGPDAAEKAQGLEAVRDAGLPLLLTIGAWTENVVVVNVVVRYAAQGSIVQYLLEAEPIFDATPALFETLGSVVAAVLADLGSAGSWLTGGFAGSLSSALDAPLANLGIAASSLSAFSSGQGLESGINGIDLSDVSAALFVAGRSGGDDLATLGLVANPGDLVADAPSLRQATNAAGLLATTVTAGAFVGRATTGLAVLQPILPL